MFYKRYIGEIQAAFIHGRANGATDNLVSFPLDPLVEHWRVGATFQATIMGSYEY